MIACSELKCSSAARQACIPEDFRRKCGGWGGGGWCGFRGFRGNGVFGFKVFKFRVLRYRDLRGVGFGFWAL